MQQKIWNFLSFPTKDSITNFLQRKSKLNKGAQISQPIRIRMIVDGSEEVAKNSSNILIRIPGQLVYADSAPRKPQIIAAK